MVNPYVRRIQSLSFIHQLLGRYFSAASRAASTAEASISYAWLPSRLCARSSSTAFTTLSAASCAALRFSASIQTGSTKGASSSAFASRWARREATSFSTWHRLQRNPGSRSQLHRSRTFLITSSAACRCSGVGLFILVPVVLIRTPVPPAVTNLVVHLDSRRQVPVSELVDGEGFHIILPSNLS